MRIEIDIPKEFEEHFKQDKFKDSLERIMADIWHYLEIGNCLCAGNYEYETIKMLAEALENSKTAYNIDKVVEELKERTDFLKNYTKYGNKNTKQQAESYSTMRMYEVADLVDDLIEIVKQGGVSDYVDVCECRELKDYNSLLKTNCGYVFGMGKEFKYCPYCGKKIKVVE